MPVFVAKMIRASILMEADFQTYVKGSYPFRAPGVINCMDSKETQNKDGKIIKDQFVGHLYSRIEELEALASEKDRIISQLVDSMSKTTQELEVLRNESVQKDLEISHLQQVLVRLKLDLEGDPDPIKQKLSFDNLIASLDVLIDLVDCERVDRILFQVSNDSLANFTDKQLVRILHLLENYLQSQFERDCYSAVGVYYFMKSTYNQRRTPLLKDFVETNRPYLEEIFYKVEKSGLNFQEPFTLLKIYFELELDEEAESWLAEIFRFAVLRETVEKKDAVELLYLSIVYEIENEARSFLQGSLELLKDDSYFELQMFEIYNQANQHQKNANRALEKLSELVQEPSQINPLLKVKAFEKMVHRLEVIAEKEKYSFYV